MLNFFNKLRLHHTRNDIYDTGVVRNGNLPLSYRLTIRDTYSIRKGLNLRREAPKPILPFLPTKKAHENKNELLELRPESVLPVNSLTLSEQSLTSPSPSLPEKSVDNILAFYYRVFSEDTRFMKYEFPICNEANKMLTYVFTSLGLPKMVRFSSSDLFLNTRVRGGLHHLLEELASTSTSTGTRAPYKKVIEFVTYYKGMYGRMIILVSLGVGCTVWHNFVPGVPDIAPLEHLVPRQTPYESFMDADFHYASFKKMSYVEYKYITDQVLSAIENVYPFSEIDLPSHNPNNTNSDAINSNSRVALGLGIIVAVFLGMGMMSFSSPAELELITTPQAQELITNNR